MIRQAASLEPGSSPSLGPGLAPSLVPSLGMVEAFKNLAPEALAELEAKLQIIPVARGEHLIRQGEPADALYLVVSGRFLVLRDGQAQALAEIGPGRPIGEIAFFAGGARTASVKAERDSLVLKLNVEDFEQLAGRSPAFWRTITSTLAQRLADTTARPGPPRPVRPRTIALVRAGSAPMPEPFVATLRAVFDANSRCLFLDHNSVVEHLGPDTLLDSHEATRWFNALESRYDFVVYVADGELSPWSEKAIRQADMVLCAARHPRQQVTSCAAPNALEQFASRLQKADNVRLVLMHDTRDAIAGTRIWLDRRPWVGMHHHVAAGHAPDYERLFRFVNGTAIGLVACGGGAFSAAHIGLFQALAEAGLSFDIMGGTSGGSAMTAALALGSSADEIEQHTHDIFVRRRALRRWTWPRYSLLDPTELDKALAIHFTSIDIADLWTPFFAISTNLSRNEIHCHRTGPLWHAVRASAAIPALLPPFYTANGEMLVDGCLLDNVPVKTMRVIKQGPNVVIDLDVPLMDRFDVDNASLPSRLQLLWRTLNPFARIGLPQAPGPGVVLMRSLMLNRRDSLNDLQPDDLLLVPAIPDGIGHLDWHRHAQLRSSAYTFAVAELARVKARGHPVFAVPAAVAPARIMVPAEA